MDRPHVALAVDCVVFGLDRSSLDVLLVQRRFPPGQHQWALPGGFVHPDEALEAAARRELEEEAGIRDVYLEQLYTFGDPYRDPRERVVSVAYYALAKKADHPPRAASDAEGASWFPLSDRPTLAFDHSHIVEVAIERLRNKVRYVPIGFELLPPRFTLTQLQQLYEIVLMQPLDKRNFRKKMLSMGVLVETDQVQTGVRHRAARFYRFDRKKYESLTQEGFAFDV